MSEVARRAVLRKGFRAGWNSERYSEDRRRCHWASFVLPTGASGVAGPGMVRLHYCLERDWSSPMSLISKKCRNRTNYLAVMKKNSLKKPNQYEKWGELGDLMIESLNG